MSSPHVPGQSVVHDPASLAQHTESPHVVAPQSSGQLHTVSPMPGSHVVSPQRGTSASGVTSSPPAASVMSRP